jgi:hypothetical protein
VAEQDGGSIAVRGQSLMLGLTYLQLVSLKYKRWRQLNEIIGPLRSSNGLTMHIQEAQNISGSVHVLTLGLASLLHTSVPGNRWSE